MRDTIRIGAAGAGLLFALLIGDDAARAQSAAGASPPAANPGAAAASVSPQESLTVLGRRKKFEPAPVPGPEIGPPPDKPGPHLGRYKISGDQSKKDGYDTQTGAYIAPFGSAYTGAGPVADGLASRFQH